MWTASKIWPQKAKIKAEKVTGIKGRMTVCGMMENLWSRLL